MAKKKNSAPEPEKSLLERMGEQMVHLKEEIVAGKDHLLEVAGEKIAAVKKTIKEYETMKAAYLKKPFKKAAKKVAVKAKKAVAGKKATPKKKSAPKKAGKAVKKALVPRKRSK